MIEKKLSFIFILAITLTTVIVFGGHNVKADAVVKYGKISYYVPVGPGYHGKMMTENDCALDLAYKYLPKGTTVHVKNLDNSKYKYLQKWDHGNFSQYGVIVDVLPNTFDYLGGKRSQGYIYNGRIEWNDPFVAAPAQ